MLTLWDADRRGSRRNFLRIGSLSLGGLSLLGLQDQAAFSGSVSAPVTGKSVVYVFMHGGPSQIETFDPKMTAPEGIRSATGEIATSIPGVTFGSTFPKLASMADKLAVVRSFTTGDGKHDIKPIVCRETLGANLGTFYSRVVGTNDPQTGMPTNAVLFPRAVDESTQPGNGTFGDLRATASLGQAYAPFTPGGDAELQQDMQMHMPRPRLDDRRHLLAQLEALRRAVDLKASIDGISRLREQAFSTILGGAAGALDLSNEDPAVVARYDTAPLVRPDQIDKKWNNYNNYVDNAKSLGKLMLLARRLCEAGCGFVTVTTNFVWDMHSDVNNAGVAEGMEYMGRPFDHAISTFIEDVHQRGLSDRILLVASGEMGRTPKINATGGRDHWGNLAPLLLAGGGLRMGQVIGRSNRDASEPASTPYTIANLVSTIMHTQFDLGSLRLARGLPSEMVRVATSGSPIAELF